jgi:hypothetical protein
MIRISPSSVILIILIFIASCNTNNEKKIINIASVDEHLTKGSFGYDLNFLKIYQKVIVLSGQDGQAQVIICPELQGRVMTSTAEGLDGKSFGWINYDLIKSRKCQPHINVYGGEDRFWIGPEGGQYSIFFKKGSPFDFDHWQTPSALDTEAFEVKEKEKDKASFRKTMELENYQGTKFNLTVDREVRVLTKEEIVKILKTDPGELKSVAYQSKNTITNTGQSSWTKSSGLLSIWILGMYPASEKTNVVVPYKGKSKEPFVNDDYFGKLSNERLTIRPEAIYMKTDGQYRSKIGIPQAKADSVLGSYDAKRKVLTIVKYSLPQKPHDYVNSLWKIQEFPYQGDVVNVYNDGPSKPGEKGMGNFYEMETSSPATELKPKESITHLHNTFHFYGNEELLNELSKSVLGVSLADIEEAFNAVQ